MSEKLKWSIQNGDLESVKTLVESDKEIVKKEIDGRYPLHFAADYGQTEVIEFLISKGADVNQTDKHEITPLLAAVWEGHISSVKLLLQKGADKNAKAPDGKAVKDCGENEDMQKLLN